MTAYFICLIIVVCCLSVALPAHGCNVVGNDGLEAFDSGEKSVQWLFGVIEFMELRTSYTKALTDIDGKWTTKPWKGLKDEDRPLNLSVGLIKCHKFAEHMQCSTAIRAGQSMINVKNMMNEIKQKNNKNAGNETITTSVNDLCNFTQIFVDYIIHFVSILFLMGYGPAKWAPMSLIILEDIDVNLCLSSGNEKVENFVQDADDYLFEMIDKVLESLEISLKKCVSTGITVPSIDSLKPDINHAALQKYLGDTNDLFTKRKGYYFSYSETLCQQIDVKSWLLITINNKTQGKPNLKSLLTRPDWDYLDIIWEDERNCMSKTTMDEYDELKKTNKNWKMNLFSEPFLSRYGSVNQIRDIYRTVVMRFTLIAVSECDRLRYEVEKLKSKIDEQVIEIMKVTFTENCKKISLNVHDAIEFLGHDHFMERLKPELSTFVDDFGKNVSIIVVGLMKELNSTSGLLKVNGALSYITKETSLIKNDVFDKSGFIELLRFEDAKKYTDQLKEHYPTLNFKIANIMEMSGRHHWIPAL